MYSSAAFINRNELYLVNFQEKCSSKKLFSIECEWDMDI